MENEDLTAKAKFAPKFKDIFKPMTYKVFYGGRAGGKTWAAARALLIMGYNNDLKILCVREVMTSIGKSVHTTLRDQIYELGLENFYTVEENKIYGQTNPKTKQRTEIIFAGIRNDPRQIKSTEGVDICWVEEADNVSSESWEFLEPTVLRKDTKAKRRRKAVMDSEIWITFNPNLETDATYQKWIVNPPPNTLVVEVNYWDNPWLPTKIVEAIEHMKATEFELYRHIYEGKCRAVAQGAIYGKEIERAEQQGWFVSSDDHPTRPIEYIPGYPVETYWDLGWRDSTAVWVAQYVDGLIHVIDFIEYSQKDVNWGLKMLALRNYHIDKYWLPHDAKQHHHNSPWSTFQVLVNQNLIVGIVPNLPVEQGINAVRSLWNTMRFNKQKCIAGIDRLRYYKYEATPTLIDGQVIFSEKPEHKSASHASDALRYMAIAIRPPKEKYIPYTQRRKAAGIQSMNNADFGFDLNNFGGNAPHQGKHDWMLR